MVWHANSFHLYLALGTLQLHAQTLVTPVHHDQFLALELKLVAQLAVRHKKVARAFIDQMILCVLITEDFFALFAPEGLLVKERHHDAIDILKAFGLLAVRTLLLVGGTVLGKPPRSQALVTIQIFALAALPWISDNVEADRASEVGVKLGNSHFRRDVVVVLQVLLCLGRKQRGYLGLYVWIKFWL